MVCGVDHRQHERRCAITHTFQEVRMPDSESNRKRDLECLRLASDLIELASMSLAPELKAQCLRMAADLTEQANQGHGSQ